MWRPRSRPRHIPCAGTVPSSTPPHASRDASVCRVRSVGARQIARETPENVDPAYDGMVLSFAV